VVLANVGCAGDDPDRELEAILRSLSEAVRGDVAPTFLVNAGKPVTVSDLFVPAQPVTMRLESPVLWVFHQGGAASLCGDTRRIDFVLDRMRELKAKQGFQTVYLVERPSRLLLGFVDGIRDVGLEIRRPDARDGSHAVLLEVHRPEGRILSALAGTPDAFATVDTRDEQVIPLRSPYLGRLVLELHARNNGDVSEIVQALKARTLPLMLIVDPATRGAAQRSFGNQVALPTFSDMPTLQRAAREMGMAANSYGVAMFDARALFAMAEGQRVAVAICAYRESSPVYAVLNSLSG
jgi:hypothetical protein